MDSISNVEEMPSQGPVLRDDLIKTAVDFLKIPRVASSSNERKVNFLREKGLTEAEIAVAFRQAGIPMDSFGDMYFTEAPSGLSAMTKFSITTVVVTGIFYGGYQLYKRYIQPKILSYFSDRLDKIETKLDNMMDTVKKMEAETSGERLTKSIETTVMKSQRPNYAEIHAINELKSEITSVKSLILGKTNVAKSVKNEASIPEWQLQEPITNGNSEKSKEKPSATTTSEKSSTTSTNTTVNPGSTTNGKDVSSD